MRTVLPRGSRICRTVRHSSARPVVAGVHRRQEGDPHRPFRHQRPAHRVDPLGNVAGVTIGRGQQRLSGRHRSDLRSTIPVRRPAGQQRQPRDLLQSREYSIVPAGLSRTTNLFDASANPPKFLKSFTPPPPAQPSDPLMSPWSVSVTPDNRRLFVVNQGPANSKPVVQVVYAMPPSLFGRAIGTIPLGTIIDALRMEFTSDGQDRRSGNTRSVRRRRRATQVRHGPFELELPQASGILASTRQLHVRLRAGDRSHLPPSPTLPSAASRPST